MLLRPHWHVTICPTQDVIIWALCKGSGSFNKLIIMKEIERNKGSHSNWALWQWTNQDQWGLEKMPWYSPRKCWLSISSKHPLVPFNSSSHFPILDIPSGYWCPRGPSPHYQLGKEHKDSHHHQVSPKGTWTYSYWPRNLEKQTSRYTLPSSPDRLGSYLHPYQVVATYSPFKKVDDLLQILDSIGDTGTKIVVFNLRRSEHAECPYENCNHHHPRCRHTLRYSTHPASPVLPPSSSPLLSL